jgi:hypothetical protein
MKTSIRPFRAQDLARVLRLWEEPAPVSTGDLLTVGDAVDLINADSSVAVVAEGTTGEVVGVAVGEASAVVGWIRKLAVAPGVTAPTEIAGKLLDDLESRLVDRGARKLAVLVDEQDDGRDGLEQRGYQTAPSVVYLERDVPPSATLPDGVVEVGGRMVPTGLWESLKGMDEAKEVIERRTGQAPA